MISPSLDPTLMAKYSTVIDHVAIAVKDLEESIVFYEKVLGFQVTERRKTEGKHSAMVSAVMKAGTITVVLLQGTTPDSQVTRYVEHYGPGVQHLAIAVTNLPQLVEELKESGVQFDTTIIEGGGLRQIFTKRDPGSGMMYEIIERLGGDFSDESVQNLFNQLEDHDSY
jgi:methylmalonyl-CoA/ethylmalonyl-CoA epimerase